MPTQEEVEEKQQEVQELREQLRQSRAVDNEATAERNREIQMRRLEDERRRLEGQLSLTGQQRAERNERKQSALDEAESSPTPTSGAANEPTYDELYERAQELDIEGRSDMNKDELAAAISKSRTAARPTQRPTTPTPSAPKGTTDDNKE